MIDMFNVAWQTILVAIVTSILSPLVLLWLQNNIIWRMQKKFEIKYRVFDETIEALSLFAVDALDLKLQAMKETIGELQRATHFRNKL